MSILENIMQTDTPFWTQSLPLLACPECKSSFELAGNELRCASGHSYGFDGALPLFFEQNNWQNKSDITQKMKAFYEETPFPNYEDIDSKWALVEKAEKGFFANLLNKQIKNGSKILEAGCGTGQLTNYLGIQSGRMVYGGDMCLHSLRLAESFREKNGIHNAAFLQMNLFKPAFKPETFDIVISNGVLHHTSDPYGGFVSILKLLKKGGYIVVGLYNTYGRIFTDIRRVIFRASGQTLAFLDPHLRKIKPGTPKRKAWFADQYQNPHESKHTIDEVLGWFDKNGVDFVSSIPKPSLFSEFSDNEQLFQKKPRESRMDHWLVEMNMMAKGSKEGGLFIMIGQKR